VNEPILESPVGRKKTVALIPTFFGGLRGIWLFTWKTQFTWRRFTMALASLFALRRLRLFDDLSPKAWAHHHRPRMGNPGLFLNAVSKRMARVDFPCKRSKEPSCSRSSAKNIPARRIAGSRAIPRIQRRAQRQEVEECHERIRKRAQGVLDERQFAQFQTLSTAQPIRRPPPLADLLWNRHGAILSLG